MDLKQFQYPLETDVCSAMISRWAANESESFAFAWSAEWGLFYSAKKKYIQTSAARRNTCFRSHTPWNTTCWTGALLHICALHLQAGAKTKVFWNLHLENSFSACLCEWLQFALLERVLRRLGWSNHLVCDMRLEVGSYGGCSFPNQNKILWILDDMNIVNTNIIQKEVRINFLVLFIFTIN